MNIDWVDVSGILVLLELDGRFPPFAGLHHSKKKGRHQGCFCSWKLQKGKNSQYEFLVSILTGWSVLWFLIYCVVQIKWHWLPPKRSSNNPLTFHNFSFIGIRPNRSNQLLLGKQFQPKQYLLQVFSKIIWNVWARHPECNCGSTIITSEENNQHEYWLRGHIKYPWFPGGGWW